MALPQQKFREAVFQILYAEDFALGLEEDIISMMMKELQTTRKSMAEAYSRVKAIMTKLEQIDAQITAASLEYSFERISRVERTILRLGLFEILFDDEIHPKVAIAEAVRLCRKFGTPESSQFVNAILDALFKNGIENAQTPAEPLLI